MSNPNLENEGVAECGCPYQTLSEGDPGAVFTGLNSEELYFPMVSRDYNQAFFGVPPKADAQWLPNQHLAQYFEELVSQ